MAGDWIKMRPSLLTSPKVNGIARILEESREVGRSLSTGFSGPMREIVSRNVMRNVTVAGLLTVWGAANEHTVDGVFANADLSDIDDMVGIPGFGEAMAAVGWAVEDGDAGTVTLPNFSEYNTCGKDRAAEKNAERQRRFREKRKAEQAAKSNVMNDVTNNDREEKRREEIKAPRNPPDGGGKPKRERKARTSLQTFIARCSDAGEKPISEYRPLLEYVQATGLPMEFVQLCWHEFKREFLPGGSKEARLQADWRLHFLNFVRKGYYRLWYAKADGTYELTTVGIQAKRQGEKEAA